MSALAEPMADAAAMRETFEAPGAWPATLAAYATVAGSV